MNQRIALGLTLLAGVAIGATAIQSLHAQAKPPVYVVIPTLKINDAAAYKAGITDRASDTAAAVKAQGGHYVIRGDKITRLDGTPPERLVVIAFDSVEKAQAWENSPAVKEVTAARMKSTNSLSFIIEGMPN